MPLRPRPRPLLQPPLPQVSPPLILRGGKQSGRQKRRSAASRAIAQCEKMICMEHSSSTPRHLRLREQPRKND